MDNLTPIKFTSQFTDEAIKYLEECKSKNLIPTIKEFSIILNVSEETIFAWANKKKKNENGVVTEDLARPNFYQAIQDITQYKIDQIKEEQREEVLAEVIEGIKLNPQRELFCVLYATERDFFGNGTDAYAEAYDIDKTKPNWYKTAASNAYRLLTNAEILKRIDQLMELGPLNDTVIDRQLAFVIEQNADFGAKVSAIREYNKLKARVTEKIDHTTKGKELPTPIYGGRSTD